MSKIVRITPYPQKSSPQCPRGEYQEPPRVHITVDLGGFGDFLTVVALPVTVSLIVIVLLTLAHTSRDRVILIDTQGEIHRLR